MVPFRRCFAVHVTLVRGVAGRPLCGYLLFYFCWLPSPPPRSAVSLVGWMLHAPVRSVTATYHRRCHCYIAAGKKNLPARRTYSAVLPAHHFAVPAYLRSVWFVQWFATCGCCCGSVYTHAHRGFYRYRYPSSSCHFAGCWLFYGWYDLFWFFPAFTGYLHTVLRVPHHTFVYVCSRWLRLRFGSSTTFYGWRTGSYTTSPRSAATGLGSGSSCARAVGLPDSVRSCRCAYAFLHTCLPFHHHHLPACHTLPIPSLPSPPPALRFCGGEILGDWFLYFVTHSFYYHRSAFWLVYVTTTFYFVGRWLLALPTPLPVAFYYWFGTLLHAICVPFSFCLTLPVPSLPA